MALRRVEVAARNATERLQLGEWELLVRGFRSALLFQVALSRLSHMCTNAPPLPTVSSRAWQLKSGLLKL